MAWHALIIRFKPPGTVPGIAFYPEKAVLPKAELNPDFPEIRMVFKN